VPKARRPSAQTVSVLQAFASQPAVWRYGYELGLEVGLKTGSLYPILMRLSDRGLLESSWERDPQAGRPPRRLCPPGRASCTPAGSAFVFGECIR
jgi:PadR family transcriptional regulator, regulatory protein PadR